MLRTALLLALCGLASIAAAAPASFATTEELMRAKRISPDVAVSERRAEIQATVRSRLLELRRAVERQVRAAAARRLRSR